MTELEPGEDVKFNDPADVGGNYEAFERILGLPYEMLSGDLSKTSFVDPGRHPLLPAAV